MKLLGIFLLVLSRLYAQNAGAGTIAVGNQTFNQVMGISLEGDEIKVGYNVIYYKIARAPNGVKTLTFDVYSCTSEIVYELGEDIVGPLPPRCTLLPAPVAETFSPVQEIVGDFLNDASDAPHKIVYGNPRDAKRGRQNLTVAQPAPLTDPYMIFYDGITNNIVNLDMTNFAILSQVTIPISTFVSAFGIVPTASGPAQQVWAISPQTGIFVVNVATGSLTATIPTPSLDPSNTVSVGIVFSNDGATAFYAVSYYTADSAGNHGALLVYDVASQTLTSTLLLKYAPSALLMAPDGLTAYLLSNTGMITYYDVLSGTADLSLSTYTPGLGGGYAGAGTAFIHRDGTRLFWNYGTFLQVFDLNMHKLTSSFNSGLAAGTPVLMQVSQDGSTAWFVDALGNVVVLDTRYGNVVETFTTDPESVIYPGPSN